jgi:hypothetical protein
MIGLVLSFVIILVSSMGVAAEKPTVDPTVTQLASNLGSTSGSTVGPDGALYVAEREVGADGRILRVDPQTGEVTEFASGLPQAPIPLGGVVDVAFIGNTAYALVTVVGDPLFSSSHASGIYRVDGPSSFTLIADIGAFSMNDVPTNTPIALKTGVQYALETYRGGFLVSDGHHNRVLQVTLDGEISEMIAFDNTVPTGLEVHGNTVYMAEAGPAPHEPQDGRVVAFGPKLSTATVVAYGAPLLVDVERGRGRTLYALSQGDWTGNPETDAGAPAQPDTGSLVEVNKDGTFTVITEDLDRPTSLEFIGNTAYVVTLTGEIWKIDGIGAPPYGVSR